MCLFSDPIGEAATIEMGQRSKFARVRQRLGKGGVAQMPYCITLRSKTDARITGWYDGSGGRWSTDHNRQKVFDKKGDAGPVCHELRSLCPRHADDMKLVHRLRIDAVIMCSADVKRQLYGASAVGPCGPP